MADRREWISGIKAESPPDLWPAVMERASAVPVPKTERVWTGRPSTPRRAAFVTGAAAGILALTLVVAVLQGGRLGDDPPTPTPEPSALAEVHEQLEGALWDLSIAETQLFLHRGELEAAQEELARLTDAAGATPTDAQREQIRTAQTVIEATTVGVQAARGEIELRGPRVEQLRETRAGLLPPSDASAYPDVVTVRCDGDGEGGTHVSTPVVRARADGTHVRVVNAFQTERARLFVDDTPVEEFPPATTADVLLPARPSGDVEVLCTYDEPPFDFTRPSHPLWIVSSEGGSPSETPPPVSPLDPLTLTASLDEEPVAWPEVAFLQAGDAEGDIGVQPCFHCGEQLIPSALAVDPDGSFWIADSFKARIAHFARDGSFIEAFPAEIGSAVPNSSASADLAFVGDQLYVLLEEGRSRVVPMEADGLGEPMIVSNEGQGLHIEAVIPGQDELTVMISGAEQLLGSYWAFATVDPATGQVTPSPGVRDSTGSYIDIQPVFDDAPPGTFEIRWSQPAESSLTTQELRFQVARGGEERNTPVGDTYVRTATRWGVATVMSIANGAWYLEIVPESPRITFERLPRDGFIGDVRRYLTVGSDGRVYWMRLLEDGLHIYRR
ncbi:MAG: hypothetical protein ABWY83_02770 [Actinomycetota bacterium]